MCLCAAFHLLASYARTLARHSLELQNSYQNCVEQNDLDRLLDASKFHRIFRENGGVLVPFLFSGLRVQHEHATHILYLFCSRFLFFFFLSIFFVLGCPSCTNQAANVNVSIKFYVRRTHRRLSACVCVCWCFHSGSHGLHRLHCVREWKNRCSNEHERTHLIFRTRKSTNTATKYLFRWTQVGLQKQHANRTRNTVTMTYYSFHTLRSDHTPNAVLFTIVYMPFVIQLLYFRRFILIEESIPRCRNCTTSFLIRSLSKKHYRSCARTLQHWLYRRCFVMGPRLAAQHEFRFLL